MYHILRNIKRCLHRWHFCSDVFGRNIWVAKIIWWLYSPVCGAYDYYTWFFNNKFWYFGRWMIFELLIGFNEFTVKVRRWSQRERWSRWYFLFYFSWCVLLLFWFAGRGGLSWCLAIICWKIKEVFSLLVFLYLLSSLV